MATWVRAWNLFNSWNTGERVTYPLAKQCLWLLRKFIL